MNKFVKAFYLEYIAHLKGEIRKYSDELKFFEAELKKAESNYRKGKHINLDTSKL